MSERAERRDAGDRGIDWLESSPYAQIAFTFDLKILAANGLHCALTGRPADEIVGQELFEAFPPNPDAPDANAEAPLRASVQHVRATGAPDSMPPVVHDIESPSRKGQFERRYWKLTHSPLRDADGAMLGILQTSVDVTDETVLRDAEAARRRSAESAGRLMFWELDFETERLEYSPGVLELFAFTPEELRAYSGKTPPLASRIHEEDRPAVEANMLAARDAPVGTTFASNYRIVRPNGSTRHVSASSEVVRSGEGRKQIGVMVDTSVVHRREESLRKLVAEKQAMLADVNHRVKNSLQMIASLLRIEERGAEPSLQRRLRQAVDRVAAVATVHASLYHYADMSRVNISDHLRTFCGQLADEHEGRIAVEIEDEPLYLSAERAVPLALLTNEMVSQALALAEDNVVTVILQFDGPSLLLRVANGVKSPSPNRQTFRSLAGSRLFKALLEQLGGTYDQDSSHGGNARIEFRRG